MLRNQPELNFEVHDTEDNPESQIILDKGRKVFSNNCKILFEAFMSGQVINSDNSPVREFRRRRQDLSDNNWVKISFHSNSGNLKNWWMSAEDQKFNKEKFNDNK